MGKALYRSTNGCGVDVFLNLLECGKRERGYKKEDA